MDQKWCFFIGNCPLLFLWLKISKKHFLETMLSFCYQTWSLKQKISEIDLTTSRKWTTPITKTKHKQAIKRACLPVKRFFNEWFGQIFRLDFCLFLLIQSFDIWFEFQIHNWLFKNVFFYNNQSPISFKELTVYSTACNTQLAVSRSMLALCPIEWHTMHTSNTLYDSRVD